MGGKIVNVTVMTSENTEFMVSDDISKKVKQTTVYGTVVPLFPTKNGYEYFVFRV